MATYAAVAASHGALDALDALTTYSLGVAFLSPLSRARWRWAWTPLAGANWDVPASWLNEIAWVLLPALAVCLLASAFRAWRFRRAAVDRPGGLT